MRFTQKTFGGAGPVSSRACAVVSYNGREMTMVQVAWGALGLLGAALFAMIGMFFYLGARIDHLGDRMDGLGARMDARFDALSARLDAHLEHHPG
jgi:hypothetical protein